MQNEKQLQRFRRLIIGVIAILVFLIGLGIGIGVGDNSNKKATTPVKQEKKEDTSKLSRDIVNKFLMAYYTKKDLGENRNRYKPLMTQIMYNQAVSDENQPVNQTYKGYIINQVYNDGTIYVNDKNNIAICQVNYKNDQLSKLGSTDGALIGQGNTATIELTFIKQGSQFLVNQIQNVTLSTPTGQNSNSYPEKVVVPKSQSSQSKGVQE